MTFVPYTYKTALGEFTTVQAAVLGATQPDPADWLRRHGWRRYAGAALSTLAPEVAAAYQAAVQEGRGLYLSGATGSGKTWALVAMWQAAAAGGDPMLLSAADLLEDIRRDYGRQREGHGRLSEPDYRAAPLLFLDDLGAGRTNAWVSDRLCLLIEHRQRDCLPTFVTSNYALSELAAALNQVYGEGDQLHLTRDGDRVVSRLAGMGAEVRFTGPDRRVS